MYPTQLTQALVYALENNRPVLIKGKPGVGKSDIVNQAKDILEYDMLIVHPVVEEPIDAKGMPWIENGVADFIPFGNLKLMMEAEEPLIVFIDDFGQAEFSMQKAYMQLLLSRSINGKQISPEVRFVAATNRREDKAGVGGLLEPVKSRFYSILSLEVSTEDWVAWAFKNNMPTELISFIQWRPELLNDFQPTRDIVNSPCPRTVAFVGNMINDGMPESIKYEMIAGAVGEGFAAEFTSFCELILTLPSVHQIVNDPHGTPIPNEVSAQYAMTGAIAGHMNDGNIGPLMTYLKRLSGEYQVATVKNITIKNPALCNTREYIQWASENAKEL